MIVLYMIPIQPNVVGLQFNGGGIEFFETLKHFKLNIPPALHDYRVKDHLWIVKDCSEFKAWLNRVETELAEHDVIFDSPETDESCMTLNGDRQENMTSCNDS